MWDGFFNMFSYVATTCSIIIMVFWIVAIKRLFVRKTESLSLSQQIDDYLSEKNSHQPVKIISEKSPPTLEKDTQKEEPPSFPKELIVEKKDQNKDGEKLHYVFWRYYNFSKELNLELLKEFCSLFLPEPNKKPVDDYYWTELLKSLRDKNITTTLLLLDLIDRKMSCIVKKENELLSLVDCQEKPKAFLNHVGMIRVALQS